jgi:signal transduction histidine kinase
MATKMSKWLAIAALLTLIVLWRSSDSRTLIAGFLVCAAAVVAMMQATRVRKSGWILVFLAITVLFNPLVPMVFSRGVFLTLYLGCLASFLLSLRMAQPAVKLSMASITDRTPGSESL